MSFFSPLGVCHCHLSFHENRKYPHTLLLEVELLKRLGGAVKTLGGWDRSLQPTHSSLPTVLHSVGVKITSFHRTRTSSYSLSVSFFRQPHYIPPQVCLKCSHLLSHTHSDHFKCQNKMFILFIFFFLYWWLFPNSFPLLICCPVFGQTSKWQVFFFHLLHLKLSFFCILIFLVSGLPYFHSSLHCFAFTYLTVVCSCLHCTRYSLEESSQ